MSVGLDKVALARSHVRRVNPWSELAPLCAEIAELAPGALAGLDAALVSFDNPRARLVGARLLLAAGVPFVDAGSLAERWQARVSVCDPSRALASGSCPCCAWSDDLLARAGEDVGAPCAAVETGEGFASTLVMGARAATLAVRELLALAGVVPLGASCGREVRDDLAGLRTQAFAVAGNPACAADHALAASRLETLGFEPETTSLGQLADRLGLRADDEVVLAATELVSASLCRACHRVATPYRRVGSPLPACAQCGGESTPLRRARRLRLGAASEAVVGLRADAWFARGDRFAVVSVDGARGYAFPPAPLPWEAGEAWDAARDEAQFDRLPADWDLARLRRARIGFLGVGHVGGAALAQLAPLPFAGLLFVDRDRLEQRNGPSLALVAEGGQGA